MSEQILTDRKRGDDAKIAAGLGISKRYVNKVLTGERNSKSPRAKAILKLYGELQKLNCKFEVKAEKMKTELLDQE